MSHITNIISRGFGRIATTKFPKSIQRFINKTYVKKLNLDMSEFEEPESYETLNKLFTRSLKKPREFKKDKNSIYAMCDCWVSECGKIDNNLQAFQIKGFSYSINELFGDYILNKEKEKLIGGMYANLYLSPADYHHYHVPCDMKIVKAVHIPGRLYPVNLTWLNKKLSLFAENERVILECENEEKIKFFLVFVGALNVGKMRFYFDENINTNVKNDRQTLNIYENLYLKQCDNLGYFEMGSTVLFFGQKDKFSLNIKQGQKIKYNTILAEVL